MLRLMLLKRPEHYGTYYFALHIVRLDPPIQAFAYSST